MELMLVYQRLCRSDGQFFPGPKS